MMSIIVFALMNAYIIDGYFARPFFLNDNIIVTDNHSSTIYAIKDKHIQKLISSPGSGRYYTISPDQHYIGFKFVNKHGLQCPALYDLINGKIRVLDSVNGF